MRRTTADHILPAVAYLLLGAIVTWPLAAQMGAGIVALGEDGLHNLWLIWHTREALLGRQPLFSAPLLYYPEGITLLTHGLGPALGVLALPFWPWGAAPAYNGAALLGYALSGYGLYQLARGLGLGRPAALVGGACLMLTPMVSAGFLGHLTKLFVGGLPLALLALRHALDPRRRRLWLAAPGLALLLVALHSGYQLVLAGVACVGFGVLWAARGRERGASSARRGWASRLAPGQKVTGSPGHQVTGSPGHQVTRSPGHRVTRSPGHPLTRPLWAALLAGAILAPLLLATLRAGADPRILVDLRDISRQFQPDLLLFLLPAAAGRLLGPLTQAAVAQLGITANIETTVGLGLGAGALALVGACAAPAARPWAALTLACVALSLGPTLLVAGVDTGLPMPFALFSALPGLSFFRIPGRFMLLGFVGLAVCVAYGVERLGAGGPARTAGAPAARRYAGAALALALLLAEGLPAPFAQTPIPPAPAFYRQIAADPAAYGVFDLPIHSDLNDMRSYVMLSAHYQIFQMTHAKGIAAGYLSRTYAAHPRFPALFGARPPRESPAPPLTVNGRPPDVANVQSALAAAGYRYLIWHHNLLPGHPAQVDAARLVAAAFGAQPPIAADADATVYAITATVSTTVRLGAGWHAYEGAYRWAGPEATLHVDSARAQTARLVLTPAAIFDPAAPERLGPAGSIWLQVGDGPPIAAPITIDQPTAITLQLPAGPATIRLRLAAGSFRPSDQGGSDARQLSFAARSIDLETDHEPQP